MKSKQVLDMHQMQHLQELGLDTSNASMLYCDLYDEEYILVESKHRFDKEENAILLEGVRNSVIYCKKVTPAYTLQDVLDLLPKQIGVEFIYDLCISPESISYTQFIGGEINDNLFAVPINGSLIDAAYYLLCWAIENGYVETNKNE